MSGFAIICEARAGHSLGITTLALVDRGKSRSRWWTSDNPSLAICYRKESAARFAARRLRRNSVRVIPFAYAATILREQSTEIMHHDAMADCERGWDDHKDYFGGGA